MTSYFNIGFTGQVGVKPQRIQIVTSDALNVVTAAGWLNNQPLTTKPTPTDIVDMLYSFNAATGVGTYGEFLVTSSAGILTLVQYVSPGDVTLPVTNNYFAVFDGTTGKIKQNAGTSINAGSIQAGLSGTAGGFYSYPATADTGFINIQAIANAGNYGITLNNISFGQATTLTIPDPGASAARFILSNSTGVQVINGGGFQIAVGHITTGNIAGGWQGGMIAYPVTASKGSLQVLATPNIGNTNTVVTNAAMGQASTITIPDPGVASAAFVLAPGASNAKLYFGRTPLWAGGSTLNTYSVPAVRPDSTILVHQFSSSNPVSTSNAACTVAGTLTVTFTGDPGADTELSYIIINPS
jgi:hypothetical protein